MHPELERLRKQVDWEARKGVEHPQPRFLVVAVDNVAAGWATLPEDGTIEAYFTTYVVDTWVKTHCCDLSPSYWLEEVSNVVLYREDLPEEDKDQLDREWCYGQDDCSCYVYCRDIESGKSRFVIIDTIDGDEDMTIEEAREAEQGNPSL